LSAGSVQLTDLPGEGAELTRERDDGHVVRLAPLVAQVQPLVVQAALGAPADLGRARIAAALAAGEVGGDRGRWR
jgi:hypothetical protein